MIEKKVNILLVEDDNDHIALVQRAFANYLDRFSLTAAETVDKARTCLAKEKPDIIVADMNLPDGEGIELLLEVGQQMPVVIMTSYGDEQLAVKAIKSGALDYVVKSYEYLVDMPHIVDRALREWQHIVQRKQIENDLKVRLSYEEALAKCSQLLLADTMAKEPVTEVMRLLLEASSVSRVYIFENFQDTDHGLCMRRVNEVCANAVPSQIKNGQLQYQAYDEGFSRWKKELSRGNRIGGIVETFPDSEKEILLQKGIASIMVLPIWAGKHWYGFIGFDDTQKKRLWSEQDVRLLHTAAEIIGAYTERKFAEENLIKYQAQLRSLSLQLSITEEHERRRIAADLHDHIGQTLVFSKMKLDKLISSPTPTDFVKTLGQISETLDQVLEDVENLTYHLGSPTLYELGLVVAIKEWLTEEIEQKHNIKTYFEDDGNPKMLDDDTSVFLFRSVRELLFNTIKHAKAKKAKVSLATKSDEMVVSVEDDGVGFEFSKVGLSKNKRGGYGLFSIKERLSHLGGYLDIKSQPGQGTFATIVIPINRKQNVTGV